MSTKSLVHFPHAGSPLHQVPTETKLRILSHNDGRPYAELGIVAPGIDLALFADRLEDLKALRVLFEDAYAGLQDAIWAKMLADHGVTPDGVAERTCDEC